MRHSFVSDPMKGRGQHMKNSGMAETGETGHQGETETAYKYFIRTSSVSGPPSEPYIRLSIGDISDCLIDCSVSTTVARCISCFGYQRLTPFTNTVISRSILRSLSSSRPCRLDCSGPCSLSLAHPLHTAHSLRLLVMHPPRLPLVITVLFDSKAFALLTLRLKEWRARARKRRSWRGIRGLRGQHLWCASSLLP